MMIAFDCNSDTGNLGYTEFVECASLRRYALDGYITFLCTIMVVNELDPIPCQPRASGTMPDTFWARTITCHSSSAARRSTRTRQYSWPTCRSSRGIFLDSCSSLNWPAAQGPKILVSQDQRVIAIVFIRKKSANKAVH